MRCACRPFLACLLYFTRTRLADFCQSAFIHSDAASARTPHNNLTARSSFCRMCAALSLPVTELGETFALEFARCASDFSTMALDVGLLVRLVVARHHVEDKTSEASERLKCLHAALCRTHDSVRPATRPALAAELARVESLAQRAAAYRATAQKANDKQRLRDDVAAGKPVDVVLLRQVCAGQLSPQHQRLTLHSPRMVALRGDENENILTCSPIGDVVFHPETVVSEHSTSVAYSDFVIPTGARSAATFRFEESWHLSVFFGVVVADGTRFNVNVNGGIGDGGGCLLYTSPSPRDRG